MNGKDNFDRLISRRDINFIDTLGDLEGIKFLEFGLNIIMQNIIEPDEFKLLWTLEPESIIKEYKRLIK